MKNKQVVLFSICGVVLLIISWIFVRNSLGNAMADSVNSLTAPIIGVTGAILIFISFQEQLKANKLQFKALSEQRELDMMYRFYEELKGDLQRMQQEYGTKYGQTSILDSFMNYVIDDKHSQYPEFDNYLRYTLNQFVFLAKRISRNKILNDSEVIYLIEKVLYQYRLYFGQYVKTLESNNFNSQFSISFSIEFNNVTSMMDNIDGIRLLLKKSIAQTK